jgi:type I restriction enzyme, S subunit
MSSEKQRPLIRPLFAPSVKPDWSWHRLDDVSEVYDCPHSTPELIEDASAPFVVRSQDMRSGTFLTVNAARVSLETYQERIKRIEPRFGDLLYSREGTYFGIAAAVPRGVKVCLGQRMVLIRPDPARVHHAFLRYWLNSPQIFAHIHGFRDGTVAERLNLPVIRGLAVAFPSLAEQVAIADVLSALEDRIALLRETNTTLEAISQALFKSWFVDFDPVRAKQQGLAPEGMDEATAALFPDGCEESELGLVPVGWDIGALMDLLVLQRGFDLPAADRIKGGFPIIAASGPSGTHEKAMATAPGVVTGRSGVLGRVFLVLEDYWPLNTALWVKEFRRATPCYAYELLKRLDFAAFNVGSAVPTLNRNHVHGLKYLLPAAELIQAFEKIALPLHQRALENARQAQALATVRDTLLPRLISGQLRLTDTLDSDA